MQGRLKQRSFETREGEKRTVVELEVDEIGPSLRYATRQVTKAPQRGCDRRRLRRLRPAAARRRRWQRAPADDPLGLRARRRRGGGFRRAAASTTTPSDPSVTPSIGYQEKDAWPSRRSASPRRRSEPALAAKNDYIDYKDTNLLRKYISDRGKIRARRVTGVTAAAPAAIAVAVKNAREMALLPYTSTAR